MTTPATATPNVLTDPGYLLIAPLSTAVPTNTVAGSVFTDAWNVAWINLGATTEGSTFSYSSTVEPIRVAELFDPISYRTTERAGTIAFNLAVALGQHGQRNGKEGIEKREGETADRPELGVGQFQVGLDRCGEDAEDRPVEEIEDIGQQQEGEDDIGVARAPALLTHARYSLGSC